MTRFCDGAGKYTICIPSKDITRIAEDVIELIASSLNQKTRTSSAAKLVLRKAMEMADCLPVCMDCRNSGFEEEE